MAVVEQLIRAESDGSISFGNYELPEKKKLENFEHDGDVLRVKTFTVEGVNDAQITLGLLESTEYSVFVNGSAIGKMSTNVGGKLNFSVELSDGSSAKVKIEK